MTEPGAAPELGALARLLEEIRDNQRQQLAQQAEALAIQKEQFELARTQFEKAAAIQDRAEALQATGAVMMERVRKVVVFVLPVAVVLLILIAVTTFWP